MVFGTGVDNVELARIQKALTRSERFVEQVLTPEELEKFKGAPDRILGRTLGSKGSFF